MKGSEFKSLLAATSANAVVLQTLVCSVAVEKIKGKRRHHAGVLLVDGKEVDRNSIEHGTPVTFPEDETFDVGQDTRTGVAMIEYRYDPPFKFTGKINTLTFKLESESKATESKAELGPTAAPEPDPIEESKSQRPATNVGKK
jgi:arylsulfatase